MEHLINTNITKYIRHRHQTKTEHKQDKDNHTTSTEHDYDTQETTQRKKPPQLDRTEPDYELMAYNTTYSKSGSTYKCSHCRYINAEYLNKAKQIHLRHHPYATHCKGCQQNTPTTPKIKTISRQNTHTTTNTTPPDLPTESAEKVESRRSSFRARNF